MSDKLFAEVQAGKNLKHVESTDKSAPVIEGDELGREHPTSNRFRWSQSQEERQRKLPQGGSGRCRAETRRYQRQVYPRHRG